MCKEIILDDHPGFTADFFRDVFAAFDCKKTHGTSYQCRPSGRAKKSSEGLNGALRATIPEGKENQWDLYLSYATFALNSLRNCHTGFSAHHVVFGRELNTPLSILVQNEDHFESVPITSKNAEVYELYEIYFVASQKELGY